MGLDDHGILNARQRKDKRMQEVYGFYLVDDGTMDTVLACQWCGEEVRFCSEGIDRARDGSLLRREMRRLVQEAGSDHVCEDKEVQ